MRELCRGGAIPVRPREPVSFIDLALVDAAGNMDVIQIKKLFDDALMARTPCDDNYIPAKKLSGRSHTCSICRKWGLARERVLTQRYSAKLPPGVAIHGRRY